MKRIYLILILAAAAVMLSGCGKNKVVSTASFELSEEMNGVVMTDSVTLEAENDELVSLTEIFVYDMSDVDEDTQEQIALLYDEIVAQYQTVDGVVCNGSLSGGVYTINLNVPLDSKTVEALSDMDLLSVSGDTDTDLSYETTKEKMVENGYTPVSEETDA